MIGFRGISCSMTIQGLYRNARYCSDPFSSALTAMVIPGAAFSVWGPALVLTYQLKHSASLSHFTDRRRPPPVASPPPLPPPEYCCHSSATTNYYPYAYAQHSVSILA